MEPAMSVEWGILYKITNSIQELRNIEIYISFKCCLLNENHMAELDIDDRS